MAHNALRWVLAGVALLIVGPLLGVLTGFVPSADGIGTVTPLLSSSVFTGVVVWTVAIAIAGAFGLLVTSLTTWRLGVACIGLALVWSAWGTPRLDQLVRVDGMTNPATALALDGAFVTLVACAFAWFCAKRGERLDDTEPAPPQEMGLGVLACAVGAMVAVFVIARDERVGQAMGAAVVAGFLGGFGGRILGARVPAAWLLLGFPIAALASPIIGGMLTDGSIAAATYEGDVSSLLRVMPAHWAVGLLIGFPAGCAQANAMIEKQHEPAGAESPAT